MVSTAVSKACNACFIVWLSAIVLPVNVAKFSSVSAAAPTRVNKWSTSKSAFVWSVNALTWVSVTFPVLSSVPSVSLDDTLISSNNNKSPPTSVALVKSFAFLILTSCPSTNLKSDASSLVIYL